MVVAWGWEETISQPGHHQSWQWHLRSPQMVDSPIWVLSSRPIQSPPPPSPYRLRGLGRQASMWGQRQWQFPKVEPASKKPRLYGM